MTLLWRPWEWQVCRKESLHPPRAPCSGTRNRNLSRTRKTMKHSIKGLTPPAAGSNPVCSLPLLRCYRFIKGTAMRTSQNFGVTEKFCVEIRGRKNGRLYRMGKTPLCACVKSTQNQTFYWVIFSHINLSSSSFLCRPSLPPSRADCLEILGASTSWTPMGQSTPVQGKLLQRQLHTLYNVNT